MGSEMPETGESHGSSSTASNDGGMVPNQLAVLVPTFDPSRDDIDTWAKKVELLMHAWPDGKITELVTRLILGTSGSAFQKLQLHQSELLKNDRKVIPKLVELLGGQWGRVPLEKAYECAEKALFRCQQRSDESNDSYLARADVMWSELLIKNMTLQQVQAYVVLRGSLLSAEDKKRVLVESGAENDGKLSLDRVNRAVRMLGAGFFHELTSGKRLTKQKVFDSQTMVMEDDYEGEAQEPTFVSEEVFPDDDYLEALVTEGDDDASLVCEFESAAADLLQSDAEMAACYNAYVEARKRLADRFRSRGFWPLSNKGRGKGFKGRGKGKGHQGHQQRRSPEPNLEQHVSVMRPTRPLEGRVPTERCLL